MLFLLLVNNKQAYPLLAIFVFLIPVIYQIIYWHKQYIDISLLEVVTP